MSIDLDFLKENIIGREGRKRDGSGLLKYARFLIYLLVFLTPLFFLPFTSEILEFNKQILIFTFSAAALILYLFHIVHSGRLTLKKSPANYAVLIFLAAALLISYFSDFRYQSVFGGFNTGFYGSLLSSVSFVILFFLVLNVFNDGPKDGLRLLNIFGFSLFLSILLGVLQLFGLPIFKWAGIVQTSFNTVGTINSLGIAAALLLILSISKLDLGKGRDPLGFLRIPALLLSVFTLAMINWWVVWLVAVPGVVFVLGSSSMKNWKILNYFRPLIIILLAAVFIFLKFNLAGIFGVKLPIEIAPSFRTSFKISREAISDNPVFGFGPENFPLAYDLHKSVSVNNTVFWSTRFSEPASEIFNTFVTGGLVGLIAFLFLIFTALRLGLRNYGLAPLLITFIAAWALYPFNMLLGFGLWLGLGVLALSASKKSEELVLDLEKTPKRSLMSTILFVALLVLAIAGFYFVGLRYSADLKFARALTADNPDSQTRLLVSAVNMNGREDVYSRALAGLLVSRINQEVRNLNQLKKADERQAAISRIQNFAATAVNLSNDLTKRHPADSANWFSRGLVYENLINVLNDADDWALQTYDEYSKVAPKDPAPYLKKGDIYLARADFLRALSQPRQPDANAQKQILENLKLAEENYQKAVSLKSNYALAIYNLGVVYEREGRVKDAIKQLELTRGAAPLDAGLALQLGLLYYRNNQKDQSFAELQRAVSIFPDFSNARWYLALLYEERNQLDKALEELQKIETLNQDNQVLKNKIGQLEKGKRSLPPQRVTGVEPLEEGRR